MSLPSLQDIAQHLAALAAQQRGPQAEAATHLARAANEIRRAIAAAQRTGGKNSD